MASVLQLDGKMTQKEIVDFFEWVTENSKNKKNTLKITKSKKKRLKNKQK